MPMTPTRNTPLPTRAPTPRPANTISPPFLHSSDEIQAPVDEFSSMSLLDQFLEDNNDFIGSDFSDDDMASPVIPERSVLVSLYNGQQDPFGRRTHTSSMINLQLDGFQLDLKAHLSSGCAQKNVSLSLSQMR